jgi:hypothetical protein
MQAGWAGHLFESCRDVHTIAQNIRPLGHDVAHIDADPETHATRFFQVGVMPVERPLHRDGGAHGLHRASEFSENTVARSSDNAALMLLDELGDHAPIEVQGLERAFLVGAHEATVSSHIGGEDSCKMALDAFFGHAVQLPSENAERDSVPTPS